MKHWDRPFPCLITDPNSNAEPGRGMAENWEDPLVLNLLLSLTAHWLQIYNCLYFMLGMAKSAPKTGPLDNTG